MSNYKNVHPYLTTRAKDRSKMLQCISQNLKSFDQIRKKLQYSHPYQNKFWYLLSDSKPREETLHQQYFIISYTEFNATCIYDQADFLDVSAPVGKQHEALTHPLLNKMPPFPRQRFQMNLFDGNVWISHKISLKFLRMVPISNILVVSLLTQYASLGRKW